MLRVLTAEPSLVKYFLRIFFILYFFLRLRILFLSVYKVFYHIFDEFSMRDQSMTKTFQRRQNVLCWCIIYLSKPGVRKYWHKHQKQRTKELIFCNKLKFSLYLCKKYSVKLWYFKLSLFGPTDFYNIGLQRYRNYKITVKKTQLLRKTFCRNFKPVPVRVHGHSSLRLQALIDYLALIRFLE